MFFSAIPVDDYLVAHVTNDFKLDHLSWNYTFHYQHDPRNKLIQSGRYNGNLQTLLRDGVLERLDRRDCMERYLDTTYRHKDVVVVSANTSMIDGESLDPANPHSSLIDSYQNIAQGVKWMWRTSWLCSEFTRYERSNDAMRTLNHKMWCNPQFLLPKIDSWALKSFDRNENAIVIRERTITVDYCLSAGIDVTRDGLRYSL